MSSLGPDSSLKDLFDELRPDEGMGVFPISMGKRDDGKVDLAIVITGKAEDANVLMANLMSAVDHMFQTAQQVEADRQILGADGQPANADPSIIVPK